MTAATCARLCCNSLSLPCATCEVCRTYGPLITVGYTAGALTMVRYGSDGYDPGVTVYPLGRERLTAVEAWADDTYTRTVMSMLVEIGRRAAMGFVPDGDDLAVLRSAETMLGKVRA